MQVRSFFALLFLFLFIFCACDENAPNPMQLAEIVSDYQTTVQTEIPEDVLAAMLLEAEEMTDLVQQILGMDMSKFVHITEATRQHWLMRQQQLRDKGLDKVDFHALQKAFYTQYIDAGGIAIVAPTHVEERYLLRARDAILVMTSKHPQLRDRLLSKHRNFYMVLVPQRKDIASMPESMLNWTLLNDNPNDDLLYPACSYNTGLTAPYVTGQCQAYVDKYEERAMIVFVHEFAHAIQFDVEILMPGFIDEMKAIAQDYYEQTDNKISWHEYWAYSVEEWFYNHRPSSHNFESHAEFIEFYPRIGGLLDEIFPRVTLWID